jgi:serine 3-dehydrogenase
MNRLIGKRVLVTGASAGIGEACVRRFAEQGAHVLLAARRLDRIEKLAEELRDAHGVEAHAHAVDVTDQARVVEYVETLERLDLLPDVLVNNAGKARGLDKFHEGSIEDWEEMIDTNLKGVLYMSRAILPHMVARNSGHVVHIGSTAGRWVYPKGAVYNASKFGLRAIAEGMNMDLLGTKVRVSSVDPGLTETEFSEVRFRGDTERASKVYATTSPLQAEDVADAVLYATNAPDHVDIFQIVLMPTVQRASGMVDRTGG